MKTIRTAPPETSATLEQHEADVVPAVVRAWTEPAGFTPTWKPRRKQRWKGTFLVVRMLRVVGETGPGWCGAWLLAQEIEGKAVPIDRGLIYHDWVPAQDIAALDDVGRHLGCNVRPIGDAKHGFLCDFKKRVYRNRIPLVGWRLPAQIMALAVDHTIGKRGGIFEDQFVAILGTTDPSPRRRNPKGKQRRLRNGRIQDGDYPTIGIKVLDGPRTYIAFQARGRPDPRDRIPEGGDGKPDPRYVYPGHFIDLIKNVAPFAGGIVELVEACALFDVAPPPVFPEPDASLKDRVIYAVAETEAVAALYMAVLREHREHASLGLPFDAVYSASSYAGSRGGYLDAIGVIPPLVKWRGVPRHILGYAMDALYGARTELRMRRIPGVPVPVVPTDHTGLYQAEAVRAGLWDMLIAEEFLWWEEDPEALLGQIPDLLDAIRSGVALDLRALVQVLPSGDVLPRRIKVGSLLSLAVGRVTFPGPRWYFLADVLRSVQETGVVPTILRVIGFTTKGRQHDLRSVEVPGVGLFDPNIEGADFFRFLMEARTRLKQRAARRDGPLRDRRLANLYKGMQSAACAGNLMRFDQTPDRARGWKVHIWDGDALDELDWFQPSPRPAHIDVPGPWCLPFFAGLILASGRLAEGLAFDAIAEQGGFVTYGDADSCFPLATATGARLGCLTEVTPWIS